MCIQVSSPVPLVPLPFHSLAEIALKVVDGTDWPSTIDQLTSQLETLLNTGAVLLEKSGRRWAQLAGHRRFDDDEWQLPLESMQAAKPARVSLVSGPSDEELTAISLTTTSGPELVLALDGDWTADSSTLKVFALLVSIGLDSLRQRQQLVAAERRLTAGYAAVRRWSRLGDVETVARQIVEHIASLVEADRVSLALYDPGAGALTIVATHGFPKSDVSEVMVAPGEWVIGHVYQRGAPVFVNDARQFPGPHGEQYGTHAFAVLPLRAGRETVGVLSVTEKRDRQPFGAEAQTLLRGISVVAAMAIIAARSKAEAASLAYAATVDSVTQLLNRPYFDTRLHQEMARSRREGTTLAVLIGDIDNFKKVNDSFGHQVGDDVLRIVGGIVRSSVRVFDTCARYGGDEFAILMPNCDRASALTCAERIRQRLAEHDGRKDGTLVPQLTMSIGVAVARPEEDGAALMGRADRNLYQAKANGKNAVRGESDAVRTPVVDFKSEAAVRPQREPYVLVAGMSESRAESCASIIEPLGIKVAIARSSSAALSTLQHLGPPVALIIDVTPHTDGFALIDAVPEDQTEIVLWATSRDVTEYAAARLRGRNARVLSSAAPASVLRSTLEKMLSRHARGVAVPSVAAARDAGKIIDALVEQTRRHCDAPGVAVYVKAPGDAGFRTSLGWVSETIPHVPLVLPRAVNRVMETGNAVVLPDLSRPNMIDSVAREAVEDGTRGLVAVPVRCANEVVGAICVFDLRPLSVDEKQLTALTALGRDAFGSANVEANDPLPAPPPFADRTTDRRAPTTQSTPAPSTEFPPAILERTGGEFAVAREMARARRERRDLSVVLFDVGPAAIDASASESLDERLEAVSDTLLRAIRQSDLPIRWSRNELLVVLPGLKGGEARMVAERVRAAMQAGARHRLAVSGGVAEIEAEERFADVVDRAREKVAMAVGRGHNRVV
jgi:diguanylate cyclase (GGDEF)-like protein